MKGKILLIVSTVLFSLSIANSQSPELQLLDIMKGEAFVGSLPDDVIWAEDNKSIYFHWKESKPGVKPYYKYDIELNAITEMEPEDEFLNVPSEGDYSNDKSSKIYSKNGDLFLYSEESIKRLTSTNETELNPRFYDDGNKITYLKNSNLYSFDLNTGFTKQLSDFVSGSDPKKDKNEMDKALQDSQLELFEILKQRHEESENQKEYNKKQSSSPKKIYLNGKNLDEITISPDGKYIYYQLLDKAKVTNTDNLDYTTESGYANVLKAREKVGSAQDNESLWVYQIEQDTFLQFNNKEIPRIFDKPEFYKDYPDLNSSEKFKEPRKVLIHGPDIASNGNAVVEIKSQDNKDRWFMILNPVNASWEMIERQHDDAWIGGPGITGWNMVAGNKGWMPDEISYWYHSEESGYSHLYAVNVNTKKKRALTKGKFEVHDAQLSPDSKGFYITSNELDPGEMHLYFIDLEGKNKVRITKQEGNHEVFISPDGTKMVSRYSSFNQPWELFLYDSKSSESWMQITESTNEEFKSYSWKIPELVYFKANDGEKVRARLYKPETANKNNAAIIFVHGAGYLQNAHKWWSNYYREYMFHNLLVDKGYTVIDVDYRGSKGYGRDWRCGIYRHMGGKDLSDQVDAANYLVKEHGIDASRIGIYGGSYGGFITLMALFNEAETFACGAALRSVTDWAHYNHPYTSNILNTPVEDPMAYENSSPIYFAEGLEDPLIMLHGVVDTNVQFQDIIRLNQRLIELGKKDWELAVFPVEGHGFKEASSWADEYRRILEIFEKNLN